MKKITVTVVLVYAVLILAACATGGNSASKTARQSHPIPANFVRVEGGTFQMGSNNGEDYEKPVHTVTITGFYIGKYEVTQKEWAAVTGNNPSHFKGENLPVEMVSWFDALEYCNRLSQREGLSPAYTISASDDNQTVIWNRNATGYRLPTEAEWEYAAKGGNGSPGNYAYAGSNDPDEAAWYDENSGDTTHLPGTKAPNSLGLYDMSGNVSEWCWDWHGDYLSEAQTNPMGASSGSFRIGRGGSWGSPAERVRSAARHPPDPSIRYSRLGLRLVRP